MNQEKNKRFAIVSPGRESYIQPTYTFHTREEAEKACESIRKGMPNVYVRDLREGMK